MRLLTLLKYARAVENRGLLAIRVFTFAIYKLDTTKLDF